MRTRWSPIMTGNLSPHLWEHQTCRCEVELFSFLSDKDLFAEIYRLVSVWGSNAMGTGTGGTGSVFMPGAMYFWCLPYSSIGDGIWIPFPANWRDGLIGPIYHRNSAPKSCKAHLKVSWNRGTPKSFILVGFSLINQPFWGIPICGNPHLRPLRCLQESTFQASALRDLCVRRCREEWGWPRGCCFQIDVLRMLQACIISTYLCVCMYVM